MLISVSDYEDASLNFHIIPDSTRDIEDYIKYQLQYNNDIEWFEVKAIKGLDEIISQLSNNN